MPVPRRAEEVAALGNKWLTMSYWPFLHPVLVVLAGLAREFGLERGNKTLGRSNAFRNARQYPF